MKLYELNFTLLREFKELEALFELLNQMSTVKGTRFTISIKTENDVSFIEIYLYYSSKIPFIGITRDLESLPSKETLDFLNNVEFKKVFFKFNVKNSKYISIDVLDSAYEYKLQNEKTLSCTAFNPNNEVELFALNFKLYKQFPHILEFVQILNSMLSHNCSSFIILRNIPTLYGYNYEKRSFTLNLFTNDISRPSLLFNANLHDLFNTGNITKYNMLCSQQKNPVRVYIDLKKMDKHLYPTITAHICLDVFSSHYDRILEQCKLIDYVTTP